MRTIYFPYPGGAGRLRGKGGPRRAVDPAYVKRLGELPSRDALLGQFAGCLNGVLYQMVGALEALREKRQAEAS